MSEKIFTVFIVGPTASGKTGLGARLARELGGEVISADSMQIYRRMPIAAAVPTADEMLGVPHHLLEFLEPSEEFTVADYTCLARKTAVEVATRGKTPVFVGGTGLYISSLADNIEFLPQDTDMALRAEIEQELDTLGAAQMLKRLSEIDPEAAERLHENDRRRIVRAFEVYRLTGKTISQQNEASRQGSSPFNPLLIGITYRDRERLYERINLRVDRMVEQGLLDEARNDFESNISGGGMQAIGHKELYPYFRGECSLEEALESLKRATRRYAKRQLTWFRRDTRISWIYADECEDTLGAALDIIKNFQTEVQK